MRTLKPVFAVFLITCISCKDVDNTLPSAAISHKQKVLFTPPDTGSIPANELGELIRYGRNLIQNTGLYIGPKGRVSHNTRNFMNCTNCHLQNGTKAYGLNFYTTFRSYPQFRGRENKVLSIADRINNCIERPHNGIGLPADSKEILAITAYIKWIGENYDESKHLGHGLPELDYSNLSASSARGETVYVRHCQSCHMPDGKGLFSSDSSSYEYPPLWGDQSYQESSSMHRVIKAARFILYNMPNNTSKWDKPILSPQEALDVAAFINDGALHTRPRSIHPSYPDPKHKPIDYYKGPYLDPFPDSTHAFGPWNEITEYYKSRKLKVVE